MLIFRPLAIAAGFLAFVLVAPAGLGGAAVTTVPPLLFSAQVGQTSSPVEPSQAVRRSFDCVERVNEARVAAGAAPVSFEVRVASVAAAHSSYQARVEQMTHLETAVGYVDAGQRLLTVGYQWSAWGENVAAGQVDCAAVMTAWLNSSSHRANILNPSFRHVGVGVAMGANGVRYWTMDLAAGG